MTEINIERLNKDIASFPQVFPITEDMNKRMDGVARLVMLDRYAFKDTKKDTLQADDLVVATVKPDPKFPKREICYVGTFEEDGTVSLYDEDGEILRKDDGSINYVALDYVDKPLEVYYEQIALRNAKGLAAVEIDVAKRHQVFEEFYEALVSMDFVPAGRVLYGAGSDTNVTFFNCYVMPFPHDSRGGIGEHRNKVMEIMSRGGGVGTNGSTLRPRNALARGVNGKSSGAISWLHDLAELTHLVEQGGSRRGAQMIMLADWHPDIIEFIISKMQNPNILRHLIATTKDEQIRSLAEQKLKFTPLNAEEQDTLAITAQYYSDVARKINVAEQKTHDYATQLLKDGGTYSVHNPEFLSGANISVAITKDFMEAVENDADYALRFPDVENYSEYDMALYDDHWHEKGDVREWEKLGFAIKTYRMIKAKELWNLINICATYSAEPGIFFIDNANDKTNAVAYGQQVVATNPCGEQPLAPYSVCNLAAVNLANMVDKQAKVVDYERLKRTVRVGVRMMDNVIDATPYFLEENTRQAKGERRLGLGVMGLHDLLIYCEKVYGSEEGNALVDKVFETIATEAYRQSIELAKEKGSFPFLDNYGGGHRGENRGRFVNSGYMKHMPEDIRQGVRLHGIRNSHLLTVAPTGSTGTLVGVSTGLEPYFAFKYYRSGRLGKMIEVNASIVDEYYQRYYIEYPDADRDVKPPLPPHFISSMELSPEQHADVQWIIQRWIVSSIIKSVNAPKGFTVQQVEEVYERLYKGGAKGGTVYVDGSRDTQVLTLSNDESKSEAIADEPTIGSEIGNTCPICRVGTVIDAGGCNTCDNCNAQLKCGL